MRRPKGIKTKKSVSKRFKITAGGKVVTQHAGKRHLLSGKSANRRRRLGTAKVLDVRDEYKIKASLPFTR
jgi:large subunit ribosomal protein L35